MSVRPSFRLSVRLSVHMEQLGSHWKDFNKIWYLSVFLKSLEKNQFSLKSDRNKGSFFKNQYTVLKSYLAHFFWEWEMFQTKVVQKFKTQFLFNNFFFRKSFRLRENVDKYCRTGQATWQYGALHVGYLRLQIHTQYIINIIVILYLLVIFYLLLSTTTMVARTRLNVTLYIHCLSCITYSCSQSYYNPSCTKQNKSSLYVTDKSMLRGLLWIFLKRHTESFRLWLC